MVNEDAYEFIIWARDKWDSLIHGSMFCTIFFSLFADLPTVILWMMSNQIQIFEMWNYYNLNFPITWTLYHETFRDFLMIEETYDMDSLYEIMMTPWLGETIIRHDENELLAYGLDTYIREKGGTDLIKNIFGNMLALTCVGMIVYLMKSCGGAIKACCCCCSQFMMKFRRLIVYNSILRLMIETYMPICLATFIGLQNLNGTTLTDKLNALLSWIMTFYCLFLPQRFYRF